MTLGSRGRQLSQVLEDTLAAVREDPGRDTVAIARRLGIDRDQALARLRALFDYRLVHRVISPTPAGAGWRWWPADAAAKAGSPGASGAP